jgi:hypothetical protein
MRRNAADALRAAAAGWRRRALVLAFFFLVTRPATSAAAPAAGPQEASGGQLRLPQDIGWEDWQVVREQRADRATVEVLVRKGEAPATAKVRIVLAQRPKPGFDSPEAILDTIVHTAKQQCRKVSVKSLSKGAGELIFELRGVGCAGRTGERYLPQRIAFIGQSEIEATYAAADSGWFLITPPQKADGHFDDSVPLSKWKVEEGAGSQDECERLRATLSSLALKQGQPADIEQVKAARCVSMDDPRLEGN